MGFELNETEDGEKRASKVRCYSLCHIIPDIVKLTYLKDEVEEDVHLNSVEESRWVKEPKGKAVEKIVGMNSFWNNVAYVLKLTTPLVRV